MTTTVTRIILEMEFSFNLRQNNQAITMSLVLSVFNLALCFLPCLLPFKFPMTSRSLGGGSQWSTVSYCKISLTRFVKSQEDEKLKRSSLPFISSNLLSVYYVPVQFSILPFPSDYQHIFIFDLLLFWKITSGI